MTEQITSIDDDNDFSKWDSKELKKQMILALRRLSKQQEEISQRQAEDSERVRKVAEAIDSFRAEQGKLIKAEERRGRVMVRIWAWVKSCISYAAKQASQIFIDE